jgi:lipopolysaccharide export system permease protein
MKILHKYVLSELLKTFALILSGIIVFIMISNFIDEIPILLRFKPTALMMIEYFLFRTPFLMAQAIPFALLLSILFTFSQFNKTNELLAMKSAGINFSSTVTPVLILAFLISIAAFGLNETIVSKSYEKATYIRDVVIEKKTESATEINYDLAKLSPGGKIFYIKYFDGLVGVMRGICILNVDKSFNLTYRLDAQEGVWREGSWVLKDGVERNFKNGQETEVIPFSSKNLVIKDTPSDFIVRKQSSSLEDNLTINIFRLQKIIKTLNESGFKHTEEDVNFHLKIAYPFATFILALLGVSIPFLFSTQRSLINAALGFLFTVVISFFYMGFITIGLSLGKVSLMSPFLSAWISNIIFGVLGFITLARVRK